MLKFHFDAGHGWLEVPVIELRKLKLMDKITPFSYLKNKIAYLEEDYDAAIYLDAIDKSAEIEEINDGLLSPICSYPHFPSKIQVFN